jgi:hypothetical protein
MQWYLFVILAYLLVLMGFNIYRSLKIRGQEDFMVAGRRLSLTVMVFTLICTWIGSGTFITLADMSQADIQIYMDPNDWSNLKIGYEADVTFDALPDTTYTGKVISVDPGLYTQGMTSAIHGVVELDPTEDFKLLIGMSAAVNVMPMADGNMARPCTLTGSLFPSKEIPDRVLADTKDQVPLLKFLAQTTLRSALADPTLGEEATLCGGDHIWMDLPLQNRGINPGQLAFNDQISGAMLEQAKSSLIEVIRRRRENLFL